MHDKMSAFNLKRYVNKNSRKYREDRFNLDLTYITPNIIAMSSPAYGLQGLYRNNVNDVMKFLNSKHAYHYQVYNLCFEDEDSSVFLSANNNYVFRDAKPPPFEMIESFYIEVDRWLGEDKDNVAVISCRDGKSRSGVMICCYLLHQKRFCNAAEVLKFFSLCRTTNIKAVTIPSQIRYVNYTADLVHSNLVFNSASSPDSPSLELKSIRFENLPVALHANLGFSIYHFDYFRFKEMTSQDRFVREKNIFVYDFDITDMLLLDLKRDDFDIKVFQRQRFYKKEIFNICFNMFFVVHQEKLPSFDPDQFVTRRSNASLHPSKRIGPIWEEPKTIDAAFEKSELDQVGKTDGGKMLPSTFRVVLSFAEKIKSDSTSLVTDLLAAVEEVGL